MLEKVTAWKPPSDEHVNLKEFMIDQLRLSMSNYVPSKPMKMDFDMWYDLMLSGLREDIKFNRKHLDEEKSRCSDRRAWVEELAESVPIPKHLKA